MLKMFRERHSGQMPLSRSEGLQGRAWRKNVLGPGGGWGGQGAGQNRSAMALGRVGHGTFDRMPTGPVVGAE